MCLRNLFGGANCCSWFMFVIILLLLLVVNIRQSREKKLERKLQREGEA